MPAVARQIAKDLGSLDPSHASYFSTQVTTFDNSLDTWNSDIAALKATYAGTPVAATEPWPTTCSRPPGWTTSPPGPSRRTS